MTHFTHPIYENVEGRNKGSCNGSSCVESSCCSCCCSYENIKQLHESEPEEIFYQNLEFHQDRSPQPIKIPFFINEESDLKIDDSPCYENSSFLEFPFNNNSFFDNGGAKCSIGGEEAIYQNLMVVDGNFFLPKSKDRFDLAKFMSESSVKEEDIYSQASIITYKACGWAIIFFDGVSNFTAITNVPLYLMLMKRIYYKR